jgi:hypothetical protein
LCRNAEERGWLDDRHRIEVDAGSVPSPPRDRLQQQYLQWRNSAVSTFADFAGYRLLDCVAEDKQVTAHLIQGLRQGWQNLIARRALHFSADAAQQEGARLQQLHILSNAENSWRRAVRFG